MVNSKRLTVSEAVRYINETYNEYITTHILRAWVRSGKCPFGEYIRRIDNQKGIILLFRQRLDEYFINRMSESELNRHRQGCG